MAAEPQAPQTFKTTAPPWPASRAPAAVGKYRLIREIGRGGMGVVYEAEDASLGRHVAVKLIRWEDRISLSPEIRLPREARLAGQVQHPNVVSLYDTGIYPGGVYLVMELVEGDSVHSLAFARPSWREATEIVLAATQGLIAVHALGIIHRDVKPSNLLRTKSGLVKLGDFGLARSLEPSDASRTWNMLAGTPHYMSPEQCRDEELDERTDVYSLGATYYALLTGRTPFPDGNPMQVMFAHCSAPIPDPRSVRPEIPEACAAIVRKAMAKARADRYGSAAEFAEALSKVLDGNGELPRRRRRWVWIGAAAVCCFALIATMGHWLGSNDPIAAPIAEPAPLVEPEVGRVLERRPGVLRGHRGQVRSIAFVPGGDRLVSAAEDGEVRLWDLAAKTSEVLARHDQPLASVAAHPNGKHVAAGAEKGAILRFTLGEPEVEFRRSLRATVWSLAFSPHGKRLAVGENLNVHLFDAPAGSLVKTGKQLDTYDYVVGSLAFSRDGNRLAAGCWDGTVKVYDVPSGKIRARIFHDHERPFALTFLPSGDEVVVGYRDGKLRRWHFDSGRIEEWPDPAGGLACLALSPDGRWLAWSGAWQGPVFLRDLMHGTTERYARAERSCLRSLAFSASGSMLVGADDHGEIAIWNVAPVRAAAEARR